MLPMANLSHLSRNGWLDSAAETRRAKRKRENEAARRERRLEQLRITAARFRMLKERAAR